MKRALLCLLKNLGRARAPSAPRFLCLWLVLLGVWGWGIFGRSGRDSASRHWAGIEEERQGTSISFTFPLQHIWREFSKLVPRIVGFSNRKCRMVKKIWVNQKRKDRIQSMNCRIQWKQKLSKLKTMQTNFSKVRHTLGLHGLCLGLSKCCKTPPASIWCERFRKILWQPLKWTGIAPSSSYWSFWTLKMCMRFSNRDMIARKVPPIEWKRQMLVEPSKKLEQKFCVANHQTANFAKCAQENFLRMISARMDTC